MLKLVSRDYDSYPSYKFYIPLYLEVDFDAFISIKLAVQSEELYEHEYEEQTDAQEEKD